MGGDPFFVQPPEIVAAYFEARQVKKDIDEKYEELQKAVDKLQKSNKKKLKDGQFLTAVEDWERALYYANEYKDSKIKKGRLVETSYTFNQLFVLKTRHSLTLKC